MSEEVEIDSEKTFEIELTSDKNNSYKVIFTLDNYIKITANRINDIIHNSFSSKYSFEEIKENEYFIIYNTLVDIFDELKEKINNNQIVLKENENILVVNIPLLENKEIIFELRPFIKNNNERLNQLTELIIQLKTEMNNIKKEEIENLKNETMELKVKFNDIKNNEIQLKNENKQLEKEIEYMKETENELIDKNKQIINIVNFLKNENNQLINEINELKNENNQLKNNVFQFKDENTFLKNEVSKLKEKLNILWKENKMINYLDSKIINKNEKYNEILKYWINPSKKIKAELLYRLSENGDKISTFHELCDNKGPTLALFHVNDGNIVGIYTPLSWESPFFNYTKDDLDTFIFNLNKNKKFKKSKDNSSIFCSSSCGPRAMGFGSGYADNSMRILTHNADYINEYYDKGSEILPNNNQVKENNLIETEIYKIIID